MEEKILTDKSQFPTDRIIYTHIGKSKALWISMFEHIHATYPEISHEWRYYNDGKSWLMKVTRKAKTVFWLSVQKNYYRTTFYFTAKAEEMLMSSDISDQLKKNFKEGRFYGKIRGLTVVMKSKKDLKDFEMILAIKINLK